MEPNIGARFNIKTLLVSIVCLIGAAGGSYTLYRDFNASGKAGQGPPLAKVERKESKVRRKAASSYIWSNVKLTEDLYKKDSIQTSSSSAVAIRLKGGALLELGENSLVVLDDIENLSLNFLRGSVVVRSETGDKKISVGSDGKTKVEALKIRLEKPESQSYLFTASQKPKAVLFQWQVIGTMADATILQVSKDKNFSAANTVSIEASQKTQSVLEPGNYFWRVVSSSQVLTETRQFRITSVAPLNPVWPSVMQKVPTWGENTEVQFRWTLPQSNSANTDENFFNKATHWIEVAKDAQFKAIQTKQEITPSALSAIIPKIPSGTYFYRIASAYPEHVVSSRIERFTVEQAKKLALEMQIPEDQATFESGQPMRFTWNCDASSIDYQFEIENSSGLKVVSQKLKAQSFSWKNPSTAGTYRWKVTALWQNQKIAETSWRNFALFTGKPIALVSPAQNQAIHYWGDPTKFKFTWKEDSSAKSNQTYLVQVSTDPSFKEKTISAKTSNTTFASSDLKLPEGLLHWKVTLVDEAGHAIKTSTPISFNYGIHPPLRAPASATPPEGSTLNLLELEGTPTATWEAVPDAEGYEITLSKAGKVILRTVTEKPKLELKGLGEGKYTYSIKAIDKIKRRGQPLEIKQFNVTYGDPLAAPQIISPEVQ